MKAKSVLQIKKVIYTIIAVTMMVLFFSVSTYADAEVYVQDWNLVDSGKHLDYDGNSKYMSYIDIGASTWNAHKSGVIRPDSIWVIQDVYVSDINSANGWAGMTYSNGKMELNTYYIIGDNYSTSQITNVAAHELGHALGLAHSTSEDLMDGLIAKHSDIQTLSPNDKKSYDEAYKNY